MSATAIRRELRAHIKPERAVVAPRFFKAGPGEYAEGDKFIGVTVPDTRKIARRYRDIPLEDISVLLKSEWHEERLLALLVIVDQFKRGDEKARAVLYRYYLKNTAYVNNWDLVDSSASYIVGAYLADKPERRKTRERLALSESLWERRIAMVSTLYDISVLGQADDTLVLADMLQYDSHDLIQKAVGWMLREVGKRIDQTLLAEYLEQHAATMPRTTLRYAIEHLNEDRRQYYLQKKNQ